MKKDIQKISTHALSQMHYASVAILFLRLFIGAVMLLHIIGKMQTYDNLVLVFPSILGMSAATSLILTIIFQGLFAVMIMVGIATRLFSSAMLIVSVLALIDQLQDVILGIEQMKVNFLYIGVYITLIISGSGVYGLNVPKSVQNS